MIARVLRHSVVSSAVLVICCTAVASAAFVASTASGGATYLSATLSPPTNPAASDGPCYLLSSASIRVDWTATPSAWADGYDVQRSTSSGGTYSTVGTVSGVGTTTYLNSSLPFSTTYYYKVRATKGNWRSPFTVVVSETTKSALCL